MVMNYAKSDNEHDTEIEAHTVQMLAAKTLELCHSSLYCHTFC